MEISGNQRITILAMIYEWKLETFMLLKLVLVQQETTNRTLNVSKGLWDKFWFHYSKSQDLGTHRHPKVGCYFPRQLWFHYYVFVLFAIYNKAFHNVRAEVIWYKILVSTTRNRYEI